MDKNQGKTETVYDCNVRCSDAGFHYFTVKLNIIVRHSSKNNSNLLNTLLYFYDYSCSVSTITIEYSCPSVCLCVCLCT